MSHTSHTVIHIGLYTYKHGVHFLGICVGLSVNRSNKMVMITWSASIKSSTSGKHCPVTPTASEHRWESTMKTTESSSPHPAAVRHSVGLEPVKCNTLILNVGGGVRRLWFGQQGCRLKSKLDQHDSYPDS